MKTFIWRLLRFLIIGMVPIVPFVILYVYTDPFKALRHYDSFFESNAKGIVTLNQDYVSTKTFLNYVDEQSYNSFVFGNSRSIFYPMDAWKRHLGSEASCYHFDAAGESLWGIHKKILFLYNRDTDLKNAIIVLDYETLIQSTPKDGHLFIVAPPLINNRNLLKFHFCFMKAFLDPDFLYAYIDFIRTGEIKPYMTKNFLLDDRPRSYDPKINEMRFDYYEKCIQEGCYYTENRMRCFYDRKHSSAPSNPICIKEAQKEMLVEINEVFRRAGTNVKLIISPLYDQVRLNAQDVVYLQDLFGKANVFDFSGINEFTQHYENYYENSHYRPHVAMKLMDVVYARK